MKMYIVIILSFICANAIAQTNNTHAVINTNEFRQLITSNLVTADKNFREVNGQLYNIQRSQLWERVKGEFQSKQNGIVVIQTYVERSRVIREGGGNSGIGSAGILPPATHKYREYDKRIALKNFPDYKTIAEGGDVSIIAMKTSTAEIEGTSLELWDCGTPHIVAVVSTNSIRIGTNKSQTMPVISQHTNSVK